MMVNRAQEGLFRSAVGLGERYIVPIAPKSRPLGKLVLLVLLQS